jgi:electron transfer flavoprotein alpha subunit
VTGSEGGLWVVAERPDGVLAPVSLELVTKGRDIADQLGCPLVAVLLGYRTDDALEPLLDAGADVVLVADDPALAVYESQTYLRILQRFAERHEPQIVLMGATFQGLDLAPSLAARLNPGLAAHCIDLALDESSRLVGRLAAAGEQAFASIVSLRSPQMATVCPGAFPVLRRPRGGVVHRVDVVVDRPFDLRVLETGPTSASIVAAVEEASVVVAGVRSKAGWSLIEELASTIGAVVGASWPAVDEGWACLYQMIGHSGQTIHPKVYIGIGISGDMLHMVGLKNVGLTVAINKDPCAPIFRQVDIGVVGDFREVFPRLIGALNSLESEYVAP